MCSPISPPVADYRDALLAAVTDVAENSLFTFADVSDQATFEGAASSPLDAGGSAWLNTCVDFSGSIAGRFELALPEPLARHLSASFAGAESPDDIAEGDLIDFSGELANMVCGAWLTRAFRHEAFSLQPPLVLRADPDSAEADDPSIERFYLSIDEAPIRLALRWVSGGSRRERSDGR